MKARGAGSPPCRGPPNPLRRHGQHRDVRTQCRQMTTPARSRRRSPRSAGPQTPSLRRATVIPPACPRPWPCGRTSPRHGRRGACGRRATRAPSAGTRPSHGPHVLPLARHGHRADVRRTTTTREIHTTRRRDFCFSLTAISSGHQLSAEGISVCRRRAPPQLTRRCLR